MRYVEEEEEEGEVSKRVSEEERREIEKEKGVVL